MLCRVDWNYILFLQFHNLRDIKIENHISDCWQILNHYNTYRKTLIKLKIFLYIKGKYYCERELTKQHSIIKFDLIFAYWITNIGTNPSVFSKNPLTMSIHSLDKLHSVEPLSFTNCRQNSQNVSNRNCKNTLKNGQKR